jgi:hypothetical protein
MVQSIRAMGNLADAETAWDKPANYPGKEKKKGRYRRANGQAGAVDTETAAGEADGPCNSWKRAQAAPKDVQIGEADMPKGM